MTAQDAEMPDETVARELVYAWIRVDAGTGLKMLAVPSNIEPLIKRVAQAIRTASPSVERSAVELALKALAEMFPQSTSQRRLKNAAIAALEKIR